MYATALTTETFVSRHRVTVRESSLATTPEEAATTPTPLLSTITETDAWASHASATNGFGDAVIGFEPRLVAHDGDEF